MSKILLLPAALGAVSKFSDRKESGARWACTGVSLETTKDGGFIAAATNTKYLCVVEGKAPEDPDDYPIGNNLDAVEGERDPKFSTLIPVKTWDQAFKSAAAVRSTKPILSNVVCKLGETTAGLMTTDQETRDVRETRYLDGRFPPWRDIFPKGKPKFTISFDPHYLAHVCAGVAKIIDSTKLEARVDIDIYNATKPIIVRGVNDEGTLNVRALLMPLTGGEENEQSVNNEVYGECLEIYDRAFANDAEHGDGAALSLEIFKQAMVSIAVKLKNIYVAPKDEEEHPPTGAPVVDDDADDDADDSTVDSDVEVEATTDTDVEVVAEETPIEEAEAVEPDLDDIMADMLSM